MAVISWSSDSSPSSTYKSTGGRSEASLPASEMSLEALSFLCLVNWGEPVSVGTEDAGRWISKLAGRLMSRGRGVGTSVCRKSRSVPVRWKLAGRLLLNSRGVRSSALGRWIRPRSVRGKLAGRLMLYSREVGEDSCRWGTDLSWLEGWCNKAEKHSPVCSEETFPYWACWQTDA